MPKVKLASTLRRAKCDPVKELIIGRAIVYGMSDEALAAAMQISPATLSRRKKSPSSEWSYGDIILACRALDITTDELRNAVRV